MFYLPTYNECVNLVKTKGDLVFYETKFFVDSYQISIFNYRIPRYEDFYDIFDAREIRGITFVKNLDGSIYKRFLLLRKFWNLNQVTETQYNIVKDYKIKAIHNKEDGSMISFIQLPNGKVLARTKMGIDNEQALEAMKIYESNSDIKNFVNSCLNNELVPIFEYVSFRNKIVLNYSYTDLILLKVRSLETGEYIDLSNLNTDGLRVVPSENYSSIDELIKLSETLENKEGWVVTFQNELMIKIKCEDYMNRHHLLTELSNREDYIIECIIGDQLDDILGQLDPIIDAERISWIKNIETKVCNWMIVRKFEIEELLKEYNGEIKPFAIKNVKHKNFASAIAVIRGGDIYDVIKHELKRTAQRLERAKEFLEEL